MDKRQFLGAAALAAALPAAAATPSLGAAGPALLTITGAIGKTNRAPFDPALDQMMKRHMVTFEKAFALDFKALAALPALTIRPTLEYDGKVHALRGPRLTQVLELAGASLHGKSRLAMRAVDGYVASITAEQARAQRFILATHLDGRPMALGGLGPLWALVDADRLAQLASTPLAQRFGACPWALYHIDVVA
ncbi:MAG: molybdopterin-dependent oxidoreductase [Bdellovibrionales bacterium]|nr:molybdopterin-dependent oxidoreductase [Massilia sp.]